MTLEPNGTCHESGCGRALSEAGLGSTHCRTHAAKYRTIVPRRQPATRWPNKTRFANLMRARYELPAVPPATDA